MNSTFYLPRKLSSNSNIYTEAELLAASSYVIVLAEPGAGKTELMNSLAKQLGTSAITASVFSHAGTDASNSPLVIDAFDELAKIDQSGIHKLLANARKANPTYVIISSRSSEWDHASTNTFKDFLGHAPIEVRLCEFEEAEQQAIFAHHVPEEDFSAFQSEVSRFDLAALLPNPQFLKLFADAYIHSARHFTDKRSIFAQAVKHLAQEANITVARNRNNSTFSIDQKVDRSSEVFAKILLSGAEGVSISEASQSKIYPLLTSLFSSDTSADSILATRLFKLGDSADQHRPVHKIVAEYCAADYLVKRIKAPNDSLSLHNCIPIIAPNSTVRDELRGLLGWMASLGNKPIQEAAIKLDPYTVLANGDPSQLEHSSKLLLINKLKAVEASDPYFRRGDFRRRFSVAGFFTQEVIEEIKPLLAAKGDGNLRDLILELLTGSPVIEQLEAEFRKLMLDPNEGKNTRLLASIYLLKIMDYDHHADLETLIDKESQSSIEVAAKIIQTLGSGTFELAYLASFFRICANLYTKLKNHQTSTIGVHRFIKNFIAELDLSSIEWLLNELTKELSCKCGKEFDECDSRNSISKIIGLILDRYFELAAPPFEPKRIWQWVENLNFTGHVSTDHSKAVKVLQEDDVLYRGIIAHVFGELTDREQISEIKTYKFDWHSHSGLRLYFVNNRFIVDLAFEYDNPALWAHFIVYHHLHNKKELGTNSLRQHMRKQALEKPAFMQEWARSNKQAAQFIQEHRMPNQNRRMRRRNRDQNKRRAANIKFVQDNRELVESGRHWNCLVRFADLTLMEPDSIEQEFAEKAVARNALINCFDFIASEIPDLLGLAKLQCASQYKKSETILYAACLETLRVKKSLENINTSLLQALRTNIDPGYNAVSQEEQNALQTEVDRLIFTDIKSTESFLRQYVEPQLKQVECNRPQLCLLEDEVFSDLRAKLSIEWLRKFCELALEPLDTLFDVAAQYGNRNELKKVITQRCTEFMSEFPVLTDNTDIEQKRIFWLLRAWYFLDDVPKDYWGWLKTDKDTIFLLDERSGQMNRSRHPYWPALTSKKVEFILDAFIEQWPKVDLPSHWGTGSPKEETAYRFLNRTVWLLSSDNPDDAIPVLSRLLADLRFKDLHSDLKSICASQIRAKALRDFEPPTPKEIVDLLDHNAVVTVEGLRQLVIQELQDFQQAINGGEFNTADRFYAKDERLDEVRCTEIITERLNLRLQPQDISVTPEHQLKNENRSDFTVTKMIRGTRRLLVTEVKGQWHRDLYTAAKAQLHERYSIHPDAEQQGIYIIIWFGPDEKVANHTRHGIKSAQELKRKIEEELSAELARLIDVFVLDVSRSK